MQTETERGEQVKCSETGPADCQECWRVMQQAAPSYVAMVKTRANCRAIATRAASAREALKNGGFERV